MENLNQQDINKLTKTILIGLPGVGKSTLTDEICRLIEEKTNIHIENVSSDLRLRDVRKDANNPVVKKFMASHKIPRSDFDLLIKTNEFMKKYGEPAFRDLESDVIIDMLERGEFEGKIANLGGKAMLHPKTAEAFKKRGYQVIYLKTTVKENAAHITKDFEAMLDGAVITRSNINGPILEAVQKEVPAYAHVSPAKFMENRIQKMRNVLKSPNPSRAVRKASITRKKEIYLYEQRIKVRDQKAFDIMARFNNERDKLYEQAADCVLNCSQNLKDDALRVLEIVRNKSWNTMLKHAPNER